VELITTAGLILLIFAPRDPDFVTLPRLRTPLGMGASPQRWPDEELDDASGVVRECPTSGDHSVLHVVDLGCPVLERLVATRGRDVHQLDGVLAVGKYVVHVGRISKSVRVAARQPASPRTLGLSAACGWATTR
jgi:hypothetical protein